MPNPNDYKTQKEFMDACMSETKREGLELKHRLGKCLGMWRERDGADDNKD
jgi:hypothetical protein